MPNITIREEDLTNPQAQAIDENVVYIPGSAITGPLDRPTLITSLKEFHRVFGDEAYKYAENASDNYDNNVVKDQPELSYIYAEEVLNAGLPILYERIGSGVKATIIQGNLTATALYEGKYSDDIGFRVNSTGLLEIFYGTQVVERFNVSDDPTKDNYICNIESAYLTFTASGTITFPIAGSEDAPIKLTGGSYSFNLATMEIRLKNLDKLLDKYDYNNLSFITSGGYSILKDTTHSLVEDVLKIAANRGDAIALINASKNLSANETRAMLISLGLNDKKTELTQESYSKYGACFVANYGKYRTTNYNKYKIQELPNSLGYLEAFGNSIKSNAVWIPVGNTTRGLITNLVSVDESKKITGAIMNSIIKEDELSINPIMNIKPYGYCVYGNRTLYFNDLGLADSCYLNIRVLVNTVKKAIFRAAQRFTYDINDDILWLRFKAAVEPLLDKMKTGSGIRAYKSEKLESDKKGLLKCKFSISPIEGVEDFDVTVSLTDSLVEVE